MMTRRSSSSDSDRSSARRRAIVALVFVQVWLATWLVGAESVRITIPAAIGFAVTNVGVATTGSPSAATVSFASLSVLAGRALRISLKADSNFIPPSGLAIPAANVSWTTSSPTNGTGSGGTLSTSTYNQLFQSSANRTSGSVKVTFTLAAPGAAIRAGNHTLTVRWKLESF
jgi:hypothetical protein